MDKKTLRLKALTQNIDPAAMEMDVIATKEIVDHSGDRVHVDGLDLSTFMQNPVVLWAHDHSRPPIAKVLAESIIRENGEMRCRVRFADTPFAKMIFGLYEKGFLRGWSLSFIEKEGEFSGHAWEVLQAEVIELSAVPLPCNKAALSPLQKHLGDSPEAQTVYKSIEMETNCGELAAAVKVLAGYGYTLKDLTPLPPASGAVKADEDEYVLKSIGDLTALLRG